MLISTQHTLTKGWDEMRLVDICDVLLDMTNEVRGWDELENHEVSMKIGLDTHTLTLRWEHRGCTGQDQLLTVSLRSEAEGEKAYDLDHPLLDEEYKAFKVLEFIIDHYEEFGWPAMDVEEWSMKVKIGYWTDGGDHYLSKLTLQATDYC